jgi:hypothetical protein
MGIGEQKYFWLFGTAPPTLKQAQENSSSAKKSKLGKAELLVLKHNLKMEESKERENNKLNSFLRTLLQ